MILKFSEFIVITSTVESFLFIYLFASCMVVYTASECYLNVIP